MATRFVHYVLAIEGLNKCNLPLEEKLQFLEGALLPDVAPFHMKKKTHFNRFRWRLGANRDLMEKTLADLPVKMRLGWELHLELDKLWQALCFVPNLYRLPGLLILYGGCIGKKYYEELSDFDLWVRERLPEANLQICLSILSDLEEKVLPEHEWIDAPRWRMFLGLIRDDFIKERKYKGPPFVGEKSFRKFYESGQAFGAEYMKKAKENSLL